MNFYFVLLLVSVAFAHEEERHGDHCRCEKGCGPGFEKSYLGYHGQFKGGARKHVPVYEKQVSYEKDCVVKGGHGYYHHEREPERDCPYREKRHAPCERCHCEKGCGPGFERSFLGYHGKFKGGASRHVPVYEKQVSYEKDCVVKGGRGHCPHHHEQEHHDCPYREKRHAPCERCHCEKGCGPGFERSFLGYHGKFKGGASRHVPVYEKQVSYEKDCIVKGGRGHCPHHHEQEHHDCPYREKRHAPCERCHCEKGCGPGFERSFLGYHGKFKGGASRHVPVYEKQVSYEKDCIVKGGRGGYCGHPQKEGVKYDKYEE